MPSAATLLLFAGASLALLIMPGPAVLYVATRGATQGHRAGIVSVLGVGTGSLVHVLAAAVGLSAILVASSSAYTAVKLAGAVYLVYLGIQAIRTARASGSSSSTPASNPRSMRQLYLNGVTLNILNPKLAVFFLAFLPQFVDPSSGSGTAQILALGALFVALGLITDAAYAVSAGSVGNRLFQDSRISKRLDYVAGTIYLALGLVTILAGNSATDK